MGKTSRGSSRANNASQPQGANDSVGARDSSLEEVRLQKVLSRAGVASRRQSEQLILDGRVSLNGVLVTELGVKMRPGVDVLRLDGERVGVAPSAVVLVLHKPTGTLCSENDPEKRPLVHHLVPKDLALRTVGRLDFNTEGVLLFTNDGDLSLQLSHPRFGVQRTYEARVRGIPTSETLDRLVQGVMLDDGPAHVESAQLIKSTDRNAWVRLTLTEGRNREVRRLLERVGHPVMRLRRTRFAGITADGLNPGQWRALSESEVEQLRQRGHCGHFELPPDPRRRGTRAGGAGRDRSEGGDGRVRAKLRSEAATAAKRRRKERRT